MRFFVRFRRPAEVVVICTLAHWLMGSSCKVEEYEDAIWEMTESFEKGANYVNYDLEGQIYLLDNHCQAWGDDAPEPPPIAPDCPLPDDDVTIHGAVEGCPATYIPPGVDEGTFADPFCGVRGIDDPAEAQRLLRLHRWIDVNPSFTSLETAQIVALSKLINRFGFHREGEPIRGVLLVYLPMGPEDIHVDWDGPNPEQDQFDEVLRTMCGKYPVDHDAFQTVMHELIDGATTGTIFDDDIVVTSNSYSSHQVLEVIKDKPNVFWYDIAPTFGAFTYDGRRSYGDKCLMSGCASDTDFGGYTERASCNPNPHVHDWLTNLEHSTVTQCLLVSRGDCLSQYHFGAALAFTDGDPAMDLTRDSTCAIPNNPEHSLIYTVDEDADPMGAAVWDDPNEDWDLLLDLETHTTSIGPGGTSKLWYTTEPFRKRMYDHSMQWFYWSPESTYNALWHNLDERPGATKIQLVQASGAGVEGCSDSDDTRRSCDPSELDKTADADHFEFYSIGVPDSFSGTGPYNFMWDEFEACPGLWDAMDCPECRVADAIARGSHGADDMELSYYRGTFSDDLVLPQNSLRSRDVIYLPPAGISELSDASLRAEADMLRLVYDGPLTPGYDEQIHVSRSRDSMALRADIYPPDDEEHDDIVTRAYVTVDGVLHEVFGDAGPTAEERMSRTYYHVWDLAELTEPSGRYGDLAGAWFDLGGGFTSRDPQVEGDHDGETGERRILVMQIGHDQDGRTYPLPVPDVAAFDVPTTVWSTDLVGLPITTFSVLDEIPAVSVVPSTFAAPEMDPFAGDYLGIEATTDVGLAHYFVAEWNVADTWCKAVPWDGAMCDGDDLGLMPPESIVVTLRALAANGEGNHFWAEQEVTVLRAELPGEGALADTSEYTCDGHCGAIPAPSGCYCDELCATYGDCCPDKADLCLGAFGCWDRPWCS